MLKARYADLGRQAHRFAFAVRLRTNEGLRREIAVETVTVAVPRACRSKPCPALGNTAA